MGRPFFVAENSRSILTSKPNPMLQKTIITCLLAVLFSITETMAQGCVAIRHFSSCLGNTIENSLLGKGDVLIGTNYRYFKSFRHFRGTEQEPDRVTNNTEVINHAHAWDFFATLGISTRVYASLNVPTVINTRSSLYEHGRTERYTTFSRGLGDIRFGLGFWLLDPSENPGGNLALGLGLKLPTGNFNASDIFYNVGANGGPETRPVDQSIQPGDGGFGLTLDFQLYQKLTEGLFTYASGFYLVNPRETNGIRTFRETLSPLLENEAIMAVPDQYALRAGLSQTLSPSVALSLGGRFEAVPVKDIIDGNDGFRRPGNVLSVDPGFSYMAHNFTFTLNVPVAVRRERPQSITDLQTQQMTGEPRTGDAAFADYAINAGISYRFMRKEKLSEELINTF